MKILVDHSTLLLLLPRCCWVIHLNLFSLSLEQTVTSVAILAQAAQSAEAELLAGRPPPSGDPPPILQAPSICYAIALGAPCLSFHWTTKATRNWFL